MAAGPFVLEVSESSFQVEVLARSRQVPVVVDFWAPWCGPCRTLGPVLEKLAKEYNGGFVLAKVNTDENQRLAMQFGIQGIPAVKAFRDGKVAAEFVGAQPEPQVRQFIARLAAQRAAPGGASGDELLAAGRFVEAEAAYRRALAGNGSEPAQQLGLAKALLAQGKAKEADQLLAQLTTGPEALAAQALAPLAELLKTVPGTANGGGDIEALYQGAGQTLASGNLRGALDALLDVLRRDKRYRNGEPRQVMLAVFALLGDGHALTREYRSKLASVLF